MFKCAVRVDGVVFQQPGSYCGQSNSSPARRRFANDERKLFWRYLLSNQYTWWNKFTSEKIAFDVDCIFVLLTDQIVLFCTWRRRSQHYFTQILELLNEAISRGTEYITREMDIYRLLSPKCCRCGFTLSTKRQFKLVNFSMQLSKARKHYKLIEKEKEVFRAKKITPLNAF